MIRIPLDMTMCLLWRSIQKSRFLERPHGIEVIHARQLGHCYTSITTSRPVLLRASSATTAWYSRMASPMFDRASCSVAPCE